jgi:hypothetical protein
MIPTAHASILRQRSARSTVTLAAGVVLVFWAVAPHARAQGSWAGPYNWSSSFPAGCTGWDELSHGALIPLGTYQGQVVMWHCEAGMTTQTSAWVWDPANPTVVSKVNTPVAANIFCSGMSWDSQGRLVIAGGIGSGPYDGVYQFDPSVLSTITPGTPPVITTTSTPWNNPTPNLATNHYYPTVLALNRHNVTTCSTTFGGQHIVLGGPDLNQTGLGIEFWETVPHSITSACVLAPPSYTHSFDTTTYGTETYSLSGSPDIYLDSYPRAFQLSNEQIFIMSDVDTQKYSTPPLVGPPAVPSPPNRPGQSWVIDPPNAMSTSWVLTDGPDADHNGKTNDRNYGSAVLMHTLAALDRIFVFGGTQDINWPTGPTVYGANRTVQEFQAGTNAATGTWYTHLLAPVTPSARSVANAVTLPTGDVLIEGGKFARPTPLAHNVALAPAIYTPGAVGASGSAVAMSQPNIPSGYTLPTARLYHHVTILLPDASVVTFGGDTFTSSAFPFPPSDFTADVFTPPYPSYRPVITQAPSSTSFWSSGTQGFRLYVTSTEPITKVVLLRPASLTHHFDTDQRYIELAFTSSASGTSYTLGVTNPVDTLGPPGYYTLWAIADDGVNGPAPCTQCAFIRIL